MPIFWKFLHMRTNYQYLCANTKLVLLRMILRELTLTAGEDYRCKLMHVIDTWKHLGKHTTHWKRWYRLQRLHRCTSPRHQQLWGCALQESWLFDSTLEDARTSIQESATSIHHITIMHVYLAWKTRIPYLDPSTLVGTMCSQEIRKQSLSLITTMIIKKVNTDTLTHAHTCNS